MINDINRHGGDIYGNQVKLDYSINVNPLPVPDEIKNVIKEAADELIHYPDPKCRALHAMLEEYTGIDRRYCLLGNGASELIMNIFARIRPKRLLLFSPTFNEYERCARVHGADIYKLDYRADEEAVVAAIKEHDIDMIVFCRPNNPTGTLFDLGQLMNLLDYCHKRQIRVLLDECFYSLCDEADTDRAYASVIDANKLRAYPQLVVLRAFTKCFGMPGIRLGVAYCADLDLISRIKDLLPTWNISSLAQLTACQFLRHPEYVKDYRALIKRGRDTLSAFLESKGAKVVPSSAGFIMFSTSKDLYTPLLSRGILIRDCSDMVDSKEYTYRIAVRDTEDNMELIGALEEIFNG